jgi:Mg-chelatase subunit ChlD
MNSRLAAVMVFSALLPITGCRDSSGPGNVGRTAEAPGRAHGPVDEALTPAAPVETRDGLAAAILIDVSGSMDDRVTGEDGRRARKIDVARRAARDLVEQFAAYADAHPTEPVLLGLYEFSRKDGEEDARPIMPMAAPDRAGAESALARLDPEGGTPIGQAMVAAKRELDRTGLTRRHLLVVSDGENTDGFRPQDVAAAIGRRPEAERPSMYFVAFDIEARRFDRVREAGALVLPAANGKELNDTLDMLLQGRILIEK